METDICKGLTFNFVREEVMKKCEVLTTLEEQIRYLRCVLKERKNNPTDLDYNVNRKPSFEVFIQEEIDYREFFLNRTESNAEGLVKIKGKNIDRDITRIFEAMFDAEIISSKTDIKQIVRMFFSEPLDVEKNIASYNRNKNEIDKEQRSTSRQLLNFTKILIEKSFKGKTNSIIELQKVLEKL